jgi:hypothetical protein
MKKKHKIRRANRKRTLRRRYALNPTCLVVVDLQVEFPAAIIKKTNKNAWRIIREMINNKQTIIFINYLFTKEGVPSEVPRLVTYDERNVEILSKYMTKYPDKVHFLRKNSDDGSQIIYNTIQSMNIDSVQLVGVNSENCVIDTAIGLAMKMPDKVIKIRDEGCNSDPFSGKSQDDVVYDVVFKIVTAKADNIIYPPLHSAGPTKSASQVHAFFSKEKFGINFEDQFAKHRENAVARKIGEEFISFRDEAIAIVLMDDANSENILAYPKSENLHFYGYTCELRHPNVSGSQRTIPA